MYHQQSDWNHDRTGMAETEKLYIFSLPGFLKLHQKYFNTTALEEKIAKTVSARKRSYQILYGKSFPQALQL